MFSCSCVEVSDFWNPRTSTRIASSNASTDPFFEPLTLAAAGRSARHYARLRLRPRAHRTVCGVPSTNSRFTRALLGCRDPTRRDRPRHSTRGPRALDSAERTPGQRTRAATSSDLQIVIDVTSGLTTLTRYTAWKILVYRTSPRRYSEFFHATPCRARPHDNRSVCTAAGVFMRHAHGRGSNPRDAPRRAAGRQSQSETRRRVGAATSGHVPHVDRDRAPALRACSHLETGSLLWYEQHVHSVFVRPIAIGRWGSLWRSHRL